MAPEETVKPSSSSSSKRLNRSQRRGNAGSAPNPNQADVEPAPSPSPAPADVEPAPPSLAPASDDLAALSLSHPSPPSLAPASVEPAPPSLTQASDDLAALSLSQAEADLSPPRPTQADAKTYHCCHCRQKKKAMSEIGLDEHNRRVRHKWWNRKKVIKCSRCGNVFATVPDKINHACGNF